MAASRMSVAHQPLSAAVAALALVTSLLASAPPAAAATKSVVGPVEVSGAVHADVSGPIRDVTGVAPTAPSDKQKKDKPLRPLPNMGNALRQPDGALQGTATSTSSVTSGIGFAGVGQGDYGFSDQYAPPDTNGAVGLTQYVQWVNTSFAVFDKATGAIAIGFPKAGNSLWSGFGGGCQSNNDGDPIVQYDKLANRWILTQFSVSTTPYLQCVAVSTTSDATGTYYRYAFTYGNTEFNDYPKLGVWPDGYYVSYNIFDNGSTFAGSKVCSLDRSKMLVGDATATQQCFQLSTAYGGLLPSDLDGKTPPPAGSPDYYLNFGSNSLDLWKFHVDFANSANTTFTGPSVIPVASFSAACNGGGTCIPQQGVSQQLDSLADRLMYRLAYREFGDHEAIVVNHAVTAGSSVGVRWYELRDPNGTPTVYQQGTYSPDSTYRWMGSIAMDGSGDIALGFSGSSSSVYPYVAYATRAAGDPLGTLSAETVVKAGGGSQYCPNFLYCRTLSRWGDYSAMSVDPVDDCTFWYTNEYEKSSGAFNWSTWITSFRFPGCGSTTPDFALSSSPTSQTVTAGGTTGVYTVSVTPSNGFTGDVALTASGLPSGATATFTPATVTGGSGTSSLTIATASSTPAGSYPVTITGTSGSLTHTTPVTLVVNVPDFAVSASPGSRSIKQGSAAAYTVTVSPSNGFTGSVTLSASGLPSGATASFSTNPVLNGSGTSTLTIQTATGVRGTFTIKITGTSGSVTHSTTVTLTITKH